MGVKVGAWCPHPLNNRLSFRGLFSFGFSLSYIVRITQNAQHKITAGVLAIQCNDRERKAGGLFQSLCDVLSFPLCNRLKLLHFPRAYWALSVYSRALRGARSVTTFSQRAWRLMPLALYYTVPHKTWQGKTPQKSAVQSGVFCVDASKILVKLRVSGLQRMVNYTALTQLMSIKKCFISQRNAIKKRIL